MRPSTRARSPQRQWEESQLQNNYPVTLVPETAVTPKFSASPKPFPGKFNFLSYHEKLMLVGKHCSPFEATLKSQSCCSPTRTSPYQVDLRPCQSRESFPLLESKCARQRKTSTMVEVLKPSSDHVEAFRRGIVKSPPLQIIKHVRPSTRGGLPKIQSSPKNSGPHYA
jgi:hypothetical protein